MIPSGFTNKQARVYLERENRKWPAMLVEIPHEQWPAGHKHVLRVLRSSKFLVQVYQEPNECIRLSACITAIRPGTQDWQDGLTWDDLMQIKEECGFASWWGYEVFPPSWDIVNVASMRHLWLFKEAFPFGWRS